MELFESELSDKHQTVLTVEPEPRYQPATASLPIETNEHGHTWIRIISFILLGLVLIIIIILLARWTYHHFHHDAAKIGSSSVSTKNKLSGAANNLAAGSDNSLQNSSPSNPSESSNAGRTATPAPNGNTKITNTGPGNVIGLFVASSVAAGGLHFIISLRKFNRA